MKKLTIFDLDGKKIEETSSLDFLDIKPNKQAMFDEVLAENAGKRQATFSTLTRGEVRGGGIKPRAQKHSGKAQLGSTRASHCVGGGNAFGPKPGRNFKLSINKKVVKLAIKSALSVKINNDAIFGLIDEINMAKPNTKQIVKFLKAMKLDNKKVLFIVEKNNNLIKSISNIDKVEVKTFDCVSTKDIMNASYVIIQKLSIYNLERKLS